MLEKYVQYGYVAYIRHIGHIRLDYRTADQLLDAYVICCDVCTADRKLDIGYVDSCRIAGPKVMLAHK